MILSNRFISLLFILLVFSSSKIKGQDIVKDKPHEYEAILIVGHIEDGTSDAVNDMEKIALLLEQNNFVTHKFYDNNANWNDIIKVSKNCSFLIYSGHGSNLGQGGSSGGLCIKQIISTEKILNELKLKENSVVMFQSVCRGAGSSAGDRKDIGIEEAKKRVIDYATPFLIVGASAYYANNYKNGCKNFLENLIAGSSLKESFLKSIPNGCIVEIDGALPKDKSKKIGIVSKKGGGTSILTTYTNGLKKVEKLISPKEYDIAYIGEPNFKIKR